MHVAPGPGLATLQRCDHWMSGRIEVLQRVGVRRILAATHVAACKADPKRRPGRAEREATLTDRVARRKRPDLAEMPAIFAHEWAFSTRNALAAEVGHGYRPPQQSRDCWTGGHLTDPYEQNTQQSPALGRRIAPQAEHSWRYTQASTGIDRTVANPHRGQVRTESRIGAEGIVSGFFDHVPGVARPTPPRPRGRQPDARESNGGAHHDSSAPAGLVFLSHEAT